ncbi:hypothetical protein NK718_03875 [Alsobacter sp. SYSU M60028]|uniref:Uncharacterized protein n=1 Tax=Alsobacter ponti TaxID=2962936 RepID=A0ABT1LA66_9HYPH|nr:hypothetical protein [Alsobacter ponti]
MLAVLAWPAAARAADPQCASQAREQARALLAFHVGPDIGSPVDVAPDVRVLPPVRALAGSHRFAVLELWGSVYKARYRMRLIYHVLGPDCVLMGQEIFEASAP